MSNFEEVLNLDATAQASLIRRKETKPLELVEAAIERVEKMNPDLNLVIATRRGKTMGCPAATGMYLSVCRNSYVI